MTQAPRMTDDAAMRRPAHLPVPTARVAPAEDHDPHPGPLLTVIVLALATLTAGSAAFAWLVLR